MANVPIVRGDDSVQRNATWAAMANDSREEQGIGWLASTGAQTELRGLDQFNTP